MPPRIPSIADRPDREEIDAQLDAGASLRGISLAHGVSKTTLIRYRNSRQHPPSTSPTRRVRLRSRRVTPAVASDMAEAVPCAPEDCELLVPTEAKLREVAKLLAQGHSREEIAARYRVSAGTVTDWHRRIKESGAALVQTVTAENVVATLLANMQQRSAMLWRIANKAEARAPRVAIAALDGIRKEDQHVAALADTLGVLDRFSPHLVHNDPFSLSGRARALFDEIEALVTGDLISDEPQADADPVAAREAQRDEKRPDL